MRSAIFILALLSSTTVRAKDSGLPVPPVPPVAPPPMDAPMPNFNAPVPADTVVQSPVTFDPAINHRATPVTGYGYAPGARYQLDNDRHLFVPGVMLRMPLP